MCFDNMTSPEVEIDLDFLTQPIRQLDFRLQSGCSPIQSQGLSRPIEMGEHPLAYHNSQDGPPNGQSRSPIVPPVRPQSWRPTKRGSPFCNIKKCPQVVLETSNSRVRTFHSEIPYFSGQPSVFCNLVALFLVFTLQNLSLSPALI